MAQLKLNNLDEDLIRRLKTRATRNHRSEDAEHLAILKAALRPFPADFWKRAAGLRAATRGRAVTDSAILIREDRDRQPRS
jgi:antitoxin FitA